MVEKYRGVLPAGSIWFHLTGDEARSLIKSSPEFAAQIPPDKPLADLDDIDIQALPGKTADIEKLLKEAGLNIMNIDLQGVQEILDRLNTKALATNYEFHLHQVVDGVTPPNVAPHYFDGKTLRQPLKWEVTGPVIQPVLNKLPSSVRSGMDENHEVYQIRLDDYNSYEHLMGTTTLLTVFLNIRPEGGRCYLLPDDPDSVKNWRALLDMHAEQFPQLSQGK